MSEEDEIAQMFQRITDRNRQEDKIYAFQSDKSSETSQSSGQRSLNYVGDEHFLGLSSILYSMPSYEQAMKNIQLKADHFTDSQSQSVSAESAPDLNEDLGFQQSGKLFDFEALPLSSDEEKAKTAFENVVHAIKEVTTNSNKYIGSSVDYQPSDDDDESLEEKISKFAFNSGAKYCDQSCKKAQDVNCKKKCTKFINKKLSYAHILYMKIFKPYLPVQEVADAGGDPEAEKEASEEEE